MKNELSKLLEEVLSRYEAGESAESLAVEYGDRLENINERDFVEAESSLVREGRCVDSLRQLCDIHGAIYLAKKKKEELQQTRKETPITVFQKENQAIQGLVQDLRDALEASFADKILAKVPSFQGVFDHYEDKEIFFFPYLIRHDFRAVTQVMWAKDDEIRGLFHQVVSFAQGEEILKQKEMTKHFLDEIESMTLKENQILLPLLAKNLKPEELLSISEEMAEREHPLLQKRLTREDFGLAKKQENYAFTEGKLVLPTGTLRLEELAKILNALDEELTFIDKDGKFRYFNKPKLAAFARSKAELDEDVEDCHPLKALPAVKGVLAQLSSGAKDNVDFTLSKRGKNIMNHYAALHDQQGGYLGCLEITKIV